ncbi:enoyl-CoA hydratase/isomerase family protein [Nonomuraea sp. NPDC049480]|uniref:enoyl-CoA hydratase/isomerase family protein n=1 Tax=Nonomuraea sp. NPDC049480 TaxID=3364353 RepID=UPI003793BB6F
MTSRYDSSGFDSPVTITQESAGLLRYTFANPPINLFDPDLHDALRLLADRMHTDPELKVVVFDSADPDYFIAHLDVERLAEVPDIAGAALLADTWHDTVTRIAHAPVLTIASIRGRTRGIGSEFALACDMRFASTERALFAQPEVGFGVVPGGGAIDWLPRLLGRSRALEILTVGDDLDAVTAAQYGWINRAVPDTELDAFVDRAARRLAGFDKQALSSIKRLVNSRVSPPSPGELLQSFREILDAFSWPGAQPQFAAMNSLGWNRDGDTELNIAEVVGTLAEQIERDTARP